MKPNQSQQQREVKYRAWDRNLRKMLYVGDSPFTATMGEIIDSFEDEDLMQSTGLYDRNGKEIWGGDILKITFTDNTYTLQEVFFGSWGIELKPVLPTNLWISRDELDYCRDDNQQLAIKAKWVDGSEVRQRTENIEATGNIYERPHLLE